ncbi:O-antigen ligase family protein [Paenibacillus sp. Soil522]|uniref:O-antigen ligase family protein n=1 Tax=Paenibacillus sp. Soil522 TaxID=1736388 RepID=UPI0006F7037C|nr:O-antigen ligase family protein [Paenibacillus sp. Soil522]KRE51275.1 hypothetical protein ASG81_03710 [Paenibacillus sp. Soil522]
MRGRRVGSANGFHRSTAVSTLAAYAAAAIAVAGVSVLLPPVQTFGISLLLLSILPALLLGICASHWQLPYVTAVWAFMPEVRRVYDWLLGSYSQIPLLSIAPLLATLTLAVPLLRRERTQQLPKLVRIALIIFLAACAYALAVGVKTNVTAAMFDLAGYTVPLLVVPYALLSGAGERERNVWIRAYATIASIVAVYGIAQYLLAPAWDVFWMQHVEMNSIGQPEPLHIRVFATLNSPGPAGGFLAGALVPMLLEKRWRGAFGWIGTAAVALCLALTMVRASWIVCAAAVFFYAATDAPGKRWRTLTRLGVCAVMLLGIVSVMPGGDALLGRFQSLGSPSEDQSFNDRVAFTLTLVPYMAAHPFGSGLGSVGIGTKLDNDGSLGAFGDFDNGFGALAVTFGPLFFLAFAGSVWLLGRAALNRLRAIGAEDRGARLARAALLGAGIQLFFSNAYVGLNGYLLWLSVGAGLAGAWHARDEEFVAVSTQGKDGNAP